MQVKFNPNSPLVQTLRTLQASGAHARYLAIQAMAAELYRHMEHHAPKDTKRYARGWAEAARAVGIPAVVPALRESRHKDALARVLAEQVTKIGRRLQALKLQKHVWYEQSGRAPDKWSRRLDREIEKQEERLRVAEQRARDFGLNPQAIVIMRRTAAALVGYQRELSPTALKAEIRLKIYGGTGTIRDVGTAAIVTLHNREPHSTVLEKKHRIFGNALDSVKQFGIRKVGATYMKNLTAQSSGFGLGAVFRQIT